MIRFSRNDTDKAKAAVLSLNKARTSNKTYNTPGVNAARYDPILDCSQIDVDLKIAFRKKGYFGTDETYEFTVLEDDIEVKNTAELLYAAYYGNTPQKRLEATNIRRALRRNLSDFKNMIREYEDAEGTDKEDLKYAIRTEVSRGSSFTAFKRWLLWDHKERYGEILQFCGLD